VNGAEQTRNTELGTAALSTSVRVLLHAGFVLTGIVTVLLGPLLPLLAARWLISDDQAGLLFTAQFAGALLGVLSSGALLERRGYALTILLGFGLMGAGVAALGFGAWTLGMAAVFVYGMGLGWTIPATNLWVAEMASQRPAGALSILNLAWSMGAVACPALLDLFKNKIGVRGFEVSLAVSLGLMACLLLPSWWAASQRPNSAGVQAEIPGAVPWKRRPALSLAAMFFLYVGTETALGGWVASFAKRVGAGGESAWLLTPSFFWGALLLGRACAPILLQLVSETVLVPAGLLLASGGMLGLILSRTVGGIVAGACVAGLGLAPIFPILVAWLSQQLGSAAKRAGGPMFALGNVGGATLPWLVGFASTQSRSLRAGLVVPLCGSVLMMVLQAGKFRTERASRAELGAES
jgi:MFS transporter, FHS family, glucose/mannose:H+ symporter